VLRALEQKPELRYQQASQVKTAIDAIGSNANEPVSDPERIVHIGSTAVKRASRMWDSGVDYKSKNTWFGLPLVHVASGQDPVTGRARIARGIIAIGGIAQGVVAIGGVAMGGFTFGGLSLGLFAYGGCAFGLAAFGGLAIALLLAVGGLAIAPIAVGGGAIGYLAYGGTAHGAHALGTNAFDAAAQQFFEPWGRTFMAGANVVNLVLVLFVVGIGAGVPLWLQLRPRSPHPPDRRAILRTMILHGLILLALVGVLNSSVGVMNEYASIFAGFDVPLSPGTRIVISVSNVVHRWWPIVVPVVLGLDLAGCLMAQQLGGSRGRRWWSRIIGVAVFIVLAFSAKTLISSLMGFGSQIHASEKTRSVTPAVSDKPEAIGAKQSQLLEVGMPGTKLLSIDGAVLGLDTEKPIAGARVLITLAGQPDQQEYHDGDRRCPGHGICSGLRNEHSDDRSQSG
jgi:hypothetical protein